VLRLILLEHIARTGRRGDDLVFGRTASAPFTPTHVRNCALTAWDAANVKRAEKELPLLVPIGLHECRHSFVSLMHAAGRSLEEIGDYVRALVRVHDRPVPAPARRRTYGGRIGARRSARSFFPGGASSGGRSSVDCMVIEEPPFVFFRNDPDNGDLSIDVCDERYGDLRRLVFRATGNGGLRYAWTEPHSQHVAGAQTGAQGR
jgi:hypothetical protein